MNSRTSPADAFQLLLSSGQVRQTTCALPCDECLQSELHKRCLFIYARKSRSLFQQIIIDVQGSPHMHQYASFMHMLARRILWRNEWHKRHDNSIKRTEYEWVSVFEASGEIDRPQSDYERLRCIKIRRASPWSARPWPGSTSAPTMLQAP